MTMTFGRRLAISLLLWAWYTALALVVASPFFAWISGATGAAPATDPLLDGVQFGTLMEMLQASPGPLVGVRGAIPAAMVLALLSNAFLGGGLFALLAGRTAGEGPLLARFFAAAGRFFFRSLGLLALTTVLALIAGALAAGVGGLVLRVLLSGAGEPGSAVRTAILLVLLAGVAAFFVLALDYARAWLVREDARGVVRTWMRGAWLVVRRPLPAAAPGVIYGVAIWAALALGAWVGASRGSRTWGTILGVLLAQQALLYLRVFLRVQMIAAEGRVAGRQWAVEAQAPDVTVARRAEPLPAEDGAQPATAVAAAQEPVPQEPEAEQQPAGPTGL